MWLFFQGFIIKNLISMIILKEKVGQQAWASKSKFKIFDNLMICIFFCFHLYGAQYKPSPVLMRSNLTPVHCDIPWFLFVQQFLVAAHSANIWELLQYLLHTHYKWTCHSSPKLPLLSCSPHTVSHQPLWNGLFLCRPPNFNSLSASQFQFFVGPPHFQVFSDLPPFQHWKEKQLATNQSWNSPKF